MIIHSPQPWTDFREGEHFFEGNLAAWQALEEAYKAGKLRAIGVSNFERPDLDNLLQNGTVRPMVNQILAHPGTPQQTLFATHKVREFWSRPTLRSHMGKFLTGLNSGLLLINMV